VIVTWPLARPATVGVKVTETVQIPATVSELPQVLDLIAKGATVVIPLPPNVRV